MIFRSRWIMLTTAAFTFISFHALAQPHRSATDEQIISQARLIAGGDKVELYQHGGISVDSAFLKLAEDAYGKIEALTSVQWDTATLGSKLRMYVSDSGECLMFGKDTTIQTIPRESSF